MSIETKTTDPIPSDILADGEAVLEAVMAGRRSDSDLARRVRERAERVTEDIQRKHGVLEIGTQTIRKLRDA